MSSLPEKPTSVGQEDFGVKKDIGEKVPTDRDSNSAEGDIDIDFSGVDEAKTLRKMDIRLIPVLAVLYLLAFLDRGNIGNAKIQGLTKDLHLSANGYNIASTV
jgi:hypothetical protein